MGKLIRVDEGDYAKIKNLKYAEKLDTMKDVIHLLVEEHKDEVPA